MLIGRTRASRSQPAWIQTYRAVEHGFAKGQCEKRSLISRFPDGIRDFAEAFVTLQERRHGADYDPTSRFRRSEVEALIVAAERAIAALEHAPAVDRRAFGPRAPQAPAPLADPPPHAPRLPPIEEQVVQDHAGHDGLAHRHRADADAGVVPALGDDLGLLARDGDRPSRREDR